MADYRKEFPDFPEADMPAIPEGFADSSWHNDSSPSFTSEALGLRIWIDFADPEQRDIREGCRFGLEPSDNLDEITDPIATDDWAVILAAVEDERSMLAYCLEELAKGGGAVAKWKLDNTHFDVLLKRGVIRQEGDLLIHPAARKLSDLAFTMEPPKDMRVLHSGVNEGPAVMMLNQLVANFNATGGWYLRYREEHMREALETCGWYEGLHQNGQYLVLSLDRMHLEPHPDHPANLLAAK